MSSSILMQVFLRRGLLSSGERKVMRCLVNARELQLETLLVPVLMYGSETRIWKEKERSRIRAGIQIDNLRGWVGS